jgi:hypothetical protein
MFLGKMSVSALLEFVKVKAQVSARLEYLTLKSQFCMI